MRQVDPMPIHYSEAGRAGESRDSTVKAWIAVALLVLQGVATTPQDIGCSFQDFRSLLHKLNDSSIVDVPIISFDFFAEA